MPDPNSVFIYSASLQTSQLDSLYSKNSSGTSITGISLAVYDSEGQEISDQSSADLNAVKTVLEFAPEFSYEIIGSAIFQNAAPLLPVYLFYKIVPSIDGGVESLTGGFDLSNTKGGEIFNFSPDRARYLPYNPGVGSNVIHAILNHQAGFKHKLTMMLRIKIS